jgi:hypothetical protein
MFLPQRMQSSFAISMISFMPWSSGDGECNLVFICADEGKLWEGMKLCRSSIAWARSRKCALWRISSDTHFDLAPMAKKLMAYEVSPRYVLRF